jgi:gamma-glutamylcyclotransferase (GGCT)/AIG2-like uncharacterized protein YtfP
MNKFFVYGTLMSSMSNHRVIPIEAIESIEPATVEGMNLYQYAKSSFPAMTFGSGQVIGQVITIKKNFVKQATKMMDRLEGYVGPNDSRNFYDRVTEHCTLSDGSKVKANMYILDELNKGLGEPITDGDFRNFINSKRGNVV